MGPQGVVGTSGHSAGHPRLCGMELCLQWDGQPQDGRREDVKAESLVAAALRQMVSPVSPVAEDGMDSRGRNPVGCRRRRRQIVKRKGRGDDISGRRGPRRKKKRPLGPELTDSRPRPSVSSSFRVIHGRHYLFEISVCPTLLSKPSLPPYHLDGMRLKSSLGRQRNPAAVPSAAGAGAGAGPTQSPCV